MNRRGVLGWLASLFGAVGVAEGASAKLVAADQNDMLLVLSLPTYRMFDRKSNSFQAVETPQAEVDRIRDELKTQLPGVKVVIVPQWAGVRAISPGGVYYRERLAQYEVECIAKTEADLAARLAALHAPRK